MWQIRRSVVNQNGFTLIEIMGVLVIIGVLASVAIKKINDIGGTAELKAIEAGIIELNVRETLTWTNQKLAPGGYTIDNDIWSAMNSFLGTGYTWTVIPDETGGTLQFRSQTIVLTRTASTDISAGKWN
jgi:prepilin-type N-terminal cleavage/methylation domain-containing protein